MENKKIKKIGVQPFIIILGLFFSTSMNAQQGTNAAGGDGKGAGGTVNISIGQMEYTNFEGPGGNVSLGIQQTYTIEVLSGNEISNINLSASVYPNPSTDFVNLTFEKISFEKCSYSLYDMTGKLIFKNNVSETTTQINLSDLTNGNYLLKISEKENVVKTFKIIKTK